MVETELALAVGLVCAVIGAVRDVGVVLDDDDDDDVDDDGDGAGGGSGSRDGEDADTKRNADGVGGNGSGLARTLLASAGLLDGDGNAADATAAVVAAATAAASGGCTSAMRAPHCSHAHECERRASSRLSSGA